MQRMRMSGRAAVLEAFPKALQAETAVIQGFFATTK
jgi:hypothetical protein